MNGQAGRWLGTARVQSQAANDATAAHPVTTHQGDIRHRTRANSASAAVRASANVRMAAGQIGSIGAATSRPTTLALMPVNTARTPMRRRNSSQNGNTPTPASHRGPSATPAARRAHCRPGCWPDREGTGTAPPDRRSSIRSANACVPRTRCGRTPGGPPALQKRCSPSAKTPKNRRTGALQMVDSWGPCGREDGLKAGGAAGRRTGRF